MRIGVGYDVHRVVVGRPMVLGGVMFPGDIGLDGHSDADVALHALCDALLGAAALGDIGQHFPPSEERWRGISSLVLLEAVVRLLAERNWTVGNVDLTIVAERPRLAAQVPEMRSVIGARLGIDVDAVSVKATTNERIGFIGRGEGIAAIAIATIERSP